MIFYIYQHRKADTHEIFYVGKGKNNRCSSKSARSKHWHNTVNKHGYYSEIVVSNLDEEISLLCEQELIHKYKLIGINLVNQTNGGEGMRGWIPSEETRNKISKANSGKKRSVEVKQKLSDMRTGKKIKPWSDEAKKRMSELKKATMTDEIRRKISIANTGKTASDEAKLKMSLAKRKIEVPIE
jgi:hypothetical protein